MTLDDKYQKALDKLNAYIRDNNLRHTPERENILYTLVQLNSPLFTAEDVVEKVKDLHISVPTLYNSLELFVSARILYRIERMRGVHRVQYKWAVDPKNNMHVVCTRCGREAVFNDKAIQQIVQVRKYTNFRPEHFALTVYGVCKTCRKIEAHKRQKQGAAQSPASDNGQ